MSSKKVEIINLNTLNLISIYSLIVFTATRLILIPSYQAPVLFTANTDDIVLGKIKCTLKLTFFIVT